MLQCQSNDFEAIHSSMRVFLLLCLTAVTLGWFAPLKWKVRKDAARALAAYRARPGN